MNARSERGGNGRPGRRGIGRRPRRRRPIRRTARSRRAPRPRPQEREHVALARARLASFRRLAGPRAHQAPRAHQSPVAVSFSCACTIANLIDLSTMTNRAIDEPADAGVSTDEAPGTGRQRAARADARATPRRGPTLLAETGHRRHAHQRDHRGGRRRLRLLLQPLRPKDAIVAAVIAETKAPARPSTPTARHRGPGRGRLRRPPLLRPTRAAIPTGAGCRPAGVAHDCSPRSDPTPPAISSVASRPAGSRSTTVARSRRRRAARRRAGGPERAGPRRPPPPSRRRRPASLRPFPRGRREGRRRPLPEIPAASLA